MTIPASYFIYFDIFVLAFYLIFFICGYKRGFFVQLVNMLGLVVAAFIGWLVAPVCASYFDLWPHAWMPIQEPILEKAIYGYINELVWFILIVIVCKLIFMLLKPIARFLQSIPVIKQLSSIFGALLGIITSTIWILLLCILLNLPFINNGAQIVDATLFGTIRNTTVSIFKDLEDPLMKSDAMSKLLFDFEHLNDADRTVLKKWFEDNHIDELPIEQYTQGEDVNSSNETTEKIGEDTNE